MTDPDPPYQPPAADSGSQNPSKSASPIDLSTEPGPPGPIGPVKIQPLDLTKTEPSAPAQPISVLGFSGFRSVATTRVWLAVGLVALLAVLTLGSAWYVVHDPSKEPAIDSFLKLVFTPLIGLVGSVVGFYFGSQSERDKQ